MSNTINTTSSLTHGHRALEYINPVLRRKENKTKLEELREQEKTRFYPQFYLAEDKQITDNINPQDLTAEENAEINARKKENEERIQNWSSANEIYGKKAADFALLSIAFGTLKSFSECFENCPLLLMTSLNILEGFSFGQRGKIQFDKIYSRIDDERGVNTYQAACFGNEVSGKLSELTCLFEQYINPYALPIIGLLGNNIRNAIFPLFILPNLLWWRFRYSAHIEQDFSTCLLKYLFHKPLSLLGNKESKNEVDKIKEKKVITPAFIAKRLKNLSGIEGKVTLKKIFNLFKGLFSNDYNKVKESSKRINEFIAPILGTIGFFFMLIGIPFKAAFDLTRENNETKLQKVISLLPALGMSTQNGVYLPRFTNEQFIIREEVKELLKMDPDIETSLKTEFQRHVEERNNLFVIGFLTNVLGMLLPLVKFMRGTGPLTKFTKSLVSGLANSLIIYFFSRRRELKGRRARLRLLENKTSSNIVDSEVSKK